MSDNISNLRHAGKVAAQFQNKTTCSYCSFKYSNEESGKI